MESAFIEFVGAKLALLAGLVILVGFPQLISLPLSANKSVYYPRKIVTQAGDRRLPVLCGIILTNKRAASSSQVWRILATPPIATAWTSIGHYLSDFGWSTRVTLAIACTASVISGSNFARTESLWTVIVDASASRWGVEIYRNFSTYVLSGRALIQDSVLVFHGVIIGQCLM